MDHNDSYFMTGHFAGFMGLAYAPVAGWFEQQRAAYQRGYNAGCEERIETMRDALAVWQEERT